MRHQGHVIMESDSGYPSIRAIDRTASSSRAICRFGPLHTQIFIERGKDELLEVDAHFISPSLSPVVFKRPVLKLGPRHRRNHKQMSLEMRLVKIAARVLFEEIRNDVGVNDKHYSMLRLPESRRRSRTVRTKSSTLSSLGQKSARSESKSAMGCTP